MSAETDPSTSAEGHAASSPQRGDARRTILLAEDEDAVRDFVRLVLEQTGYVVVTATDGRAAGDLFAATPDRFDLVLTDVLMPHSTGPELAQRVRQVRPGVPVVFMSAFTGGLPLAPGLVSASELLIEKPFSVASLLQVISSALGNGDAS